MMFSLAREAWSKLKWLYFQYALHLGVVVLEPWEAALLNTVLVLALTFYTTCVFLPGHLLMWVRVIQSISPSIFAGDFSTSASWNVHESSSKSSTE
jgi:hypothetical protein